MFIPVTELHFLSLAKKKKKFTFFPLGHDFYMVIHDLTVSKLDCKNTMQEDCNKEINVVLNTAARSFWKFKTFMYQVPADFCINIQCFYFLK